MLASLYLSVEVPSDHKNLLIIPLRNTLHNQPPRILFIMRINICKNYFASSPLTLDVEPSTTVASLKAKIQDGLGISPICQRLIYGSKTFLYPEDKTLLELDISHGARITLHYMTDLGLPVFIVPEHFGLDRSATVRRVKEEAAAKLGLPADKLLLCDFIRGAEDFINTAAVHAPVRDEMSSLEDVSADNIAIKDLFPEGVVHRINAVFVSPHNGHFGFWIAYANSHDTEITFSYTWSFDFKPRFHAEDFELDSSASIRRVKEEWGDKFGIPADWLLLFVDRNKRLLLNETMSLHDCNISESDMLYIGVRNDVITASMRSRVKGVLFRRDLGSNVHHTYVKTYTPHSRHQG